MRHSNVFLATGLLLAFIGQAAGATELSGNPEELRQFLQSQTRTVTLHSQAEETAYTDVAKVTLVVTTEKKELAESLDANSKLRESIRARLTALGVPADKINSSKYSASPQYGWFGKKPLSFTVINTLDVSIDSDRLFQDVAELADSDEQISFGGVAFEHSQKEAYEAKVRDKALQSIMEDKAYFADQLGLELRPVQFAYSDVRATAPGRFGLVEEMVATAERKAAVESFAPSSPAPMQSFNEVKYHVSVSVTFAVSAQQ